MLRIMALCLLLFCLTSVTRAQPPAEPTAPKPGEAVAKVLSDAEPLSKDKKYAEILPIADRALTLAKTNGDVVGEAQSLQIRAQALQSLNRTEEAVAAWRETAATWKLAGDGPGEINALAQAGILLLYNNAAEAHTLLQLAFAAAKAEQKRPLAGATVLDQSGTVVYQKGRLNDAEACWATALAVRQKREPESLDVATSLNNLGNAAHDRGDLKAAEDYHKQALAIREKLAPASISVAMSLNNLGLVARARSDLKAAEDYLKQALALREKLSPQSMDVAGSLNNLGVVAKDKGDLSAAEDYYKRALAIKEKRVPNSLNVAISLNNLGVVTTERGDLKVAEDYHRRALAIREKLAPDSLNVASSLNNLGGLARFRGDLEVAENYHKRALAIREKLAPNSLIVATSLINLGNVADDRGNLVAAEGYDKRALAIQETLAPNSLDVAMSLENLGNIARARGDWVVAEDHYKRALAIKQKLAPDSLDVAMCLNNLGAEAYDRADLKAADNYFRRSLTIRQKLAPNSLDMADSLKDLGDVAERKGNLPVAEHLAQQAWDIVHHHAAFVSGDQARQAFENANAGYGASLLGCQLALHQPERAFATLEQGRTQALLQMLTERRLLANVRNVTLWDSYLSAVHAQDKALTAASEASSAEAHARLQLATAQENKVAPAEISLLKTVLDAAQAHFQQAEQEYTRQRVALEQTWNDIKHATPRAFPSELSLTQLKQSLSADTLYLAFTVGQDHTYLFLLGRNLPVQAFTLIIPQKVLEHKVQNLREALTNPQSGLTSFSRDSHALFALLFPTAVHKQLSRSSHLLISPDGPLWQLPFAALVTTPGASPRYLGLDTSLTVTQSLSLFARTRQEPLQHTPGQVLTALVVGDPLFIRTNRNTATSVANKANTGSPTVQVASASLTTSRGERGFLWGQDSPPSPLPHTRTEALAIANLYNTQPLLAADATEANVRARLDSADIIHLATHGYLNPRVPMASGVLLTPPEQEPASGETDNDGALQAWEIWHLKLKADLVVLSACETGLGRHVAGEGIIGLSRALQYAGCRSVIASQWKVEDKSTARLMVALHKGLRTGLSKDEALRRAMQGVASESRTHHPYYWAPFFLMGEWENRIGTGTHP
jgi:CHAT domain-containing protein/Tfp pilus assembly protein PilF